MHGRVKLYFIFTLLSLVSCKVPPSGRMIYFYHYKLHVKDNATGKPTIIFEGGLGCGTSLYDNLHPPVSGFTRVIAYDQTGIGYSTRSPNPRTLPNFAKELHLLLTQEKIDPPYILVGHSLGGFIIRYYAHKYPDEVVGLVYIDQPPDDWFKYIRNTCSSAELFKFNQFYDPVQTIRYKGVPRNEQEMYESNCELLRGIKITPQIPVRLITAINYGDLQQKIRYPPEDMSVWAEMKARVLEGVLVSIPDQNQKQLL